MGTIVKGLAFIIVLVGAVLFLIIASVSAVVGRFASWDESNNQVQISQWNAQSMAEQTKQVTVAQEQETTRYLAYLDASVQALEIQESGKTDRTELEQDTIYSTSWTSLAHRLLTPLLIVLWTAIALVWVLVLVKLFGGRGRG